MIARVFDHAAFNRMLTSGRAKVGVRISPQYTEQLIRRQQVQVLIDLGKSLPYAAIGFIETVLVLLVMRAVFAVPVHGSLLLLLTLATLFLVCALGLEIFISTLATTQLQAMQLAFIIMLPSVLLSEFMFPRSQMPGPIYWATFAIPVTYFVDILRGVVLRGADLVDLLPQVAGLAICCVVIFGISLSRFHKQLG